MLLLADGENLKQRNIPVLHAGPLNDVSTCVAERSNDCIRRERTGVEQSSRYAWVSVGIPTTLGRAALATSPPPSDVERLVAMSVGVYQFPVLAIVIPATCQLPMIWFQTPEALPPNALFLPKGKS